LAFFFRLFLFPFVRRLQVIEEREVLNDGADA
jgi:hypothetical protein